MTTIEVAEITPPAYGKKMAKIVTVSGETLYAQPGTIEVGKRYNVEIYENEFRGKKYRNIGKADLIGNSSGMVTNGNGHSPSLPQPGQQEFVTKLLCAFITSGQVTVDKAQLWETTKTLRGLWDVTFGAKANGTQH